MTTKFDIESRHKQSVAEIMRALTNDPATQHIFLLWPVLVPLTERFCNFVSPIMPALNGEPLVDYAIREAVTAYRAEKDDNTKHRAYITGLLDATIESLNGLLVQGVKRKSIITWEPFVEPMFTWMVKHQIDTIKTSKSMPNLPSAHMKLSLLVHLLPAKEIELFGFLSSRSKPLR